MKKHLFILILALPIFIGQTADAQQTEFAPIGAKWYYEYNNLLSFGYIKIESIGDTVIQAKNCKILQKTSFGYTWPGYYDTISMGREYVYSESNTVYFYRKNQFYSLFEFGPINTSWQVVGNSFFNNIDSGTVYIDSVDVELIDGILRNVAYVKSTPQSCIGWANAKIIEGIGVVNDYFFPDYIDCVFDANEGGAFRCYYFEDSLIYSTTNANYCDFIQNIENHENTKIYIHPNPFFAEFHVYMKDEQNIHDSYIEIFDIVGKKLNFNSFVSSNNSLTISIINNPPGVLFIVIHTIENKKIIKKIVKL